MKKPIPFECDVCHMNLNCTAYGVNSGIVAEPTASLHFSVSVIDSEYYEHFTHHLCGDECLTKFIQLTLIENKITIRG